MASGLWKEREVRLAWTMAVADAKGFASKRNRGTENCGLRRDRMSRLPTATYSTDVLLYGK